MPAEEFQGLPVEHCPLCGELISIEKSEVIQLEEIMCNYCNRSIKSYLPKFEEQLFFTKECNNCEKMNNTRSKYCVYCSHDFSPIRKGLRDVIPQLAVITSVGSIFLGIVLLFFSLSSNLTFVGYAAIVLGLISGSITLTYRKTKKIAIISLVISGIVALTIIILILIIVLRL